MKPKFTHESWPLALNDRAARLVADMFQRTVELRINAQTLAGGGSVLDCGVNTPGGLHAGLLLARVCLADLGQVALVPGRIGDVSCPEVQVTTDHPLAACMAAQYAGWELSEEKFFAMGSGPMRAAAGFEAVFDEIGHREGASVAVGVLESRKLPPEAIVETIATKARVPPAGVMLLVAPTASLAGGVQVVARSVETALHKLHSLRFDLERIVSAYGVAPLPPVAADDLAAIGRTNDAILYGGRVTLYVTGDDASLEAVGPRVPSSASSDHGVPFAETFERYGRDFYKVDPHLFSPAVVIFQNLETGRVHRFGTLAHDVLNRSFFG